MSYPNISRDCEVCGATFSTTSAVRLYCSSKCRLRQYRSRYGDSPIPDSIKYRERVLEMIGAGVSQRKAAQQLGINRRVVEKIKAAANGQPDVERVFSPVTVEPYKCQGCEAAGVRWVTNYKPCVRCAARKGKR
jgi:hypothetical protein